jgi:hypothetical protein
MKRYFALMTLAVVLGLAVASAAEAQVFVRAPFVRVQVGGGVYVRAPFVNLWLPPPPVYVGPPAYIAPPNVYVPPMPRVVESPAPPANEPPPLPNTPPPVPNTPAVPNNDNGPPQPAKAAQVPTLEQFAKSFQPKGGRYEVSILNPVTNQATPVRFTLPEGNPRRVDLRRNEIEFYYGIRRFVRIEFDNEGAMVTSR